MLKIRLLIGVLLAALVLSIWGAMPIHPTPADAQTEPPVLVRFVHAFPIDSAVDVYVDGALVIRDLARGTATTHWRFAPSTALIEMREAGADRNTPPLASRQVAFTTTAVGFGQMAIVLQPDGFGQPTLHVVEDLLSPTRVDGARLHLIHAVPDVPAVDVVLEGGVPFLTDARFSDPIGTLDPPVGRYRFAINAGAETLAATDMLDLAHGFLYTLVFYQNPDQSYAVSVLSAPTLPDPNATTTAVQFVHASPSAEALDVYLDDVLVVPNWQVGEVIPHTPYAAGEVTLRLRNAGLPSTSAAAYEATLDFNGEALTIIASGDLSEGTFALQTFEDVLSTLTPDNVRVRFVNATQNGPLTVTLADNTPLVNTLPIGEASGTLSLLPQRYTFEAIVDDAALGGPIFITLSDQLFIGGTWITVVAANPSPDADPILYVSGSAFQNRPTSAPDFAPPPPPSPTPTQTFTPTHTPLPPTDTPTPIVGTPPPAPTQPLIIADVNINEGVNLQCREYPSTSARSLGLIPSSARLVVIGYAGPFDTNITNNVPVDPALFSAPENATDFEQVWIYAEFYDFEQGYLLTRCWTRADFVLFYFFDGQGLNYLPDPPTLFAYAVLDPPLLNRVPANQAGRIVGQGVNNPPAVILPSPSPTPTLAPSSTPSPTITLTPTPDGSIRARVLTNANLYERANTNSAVLRSIPAPSVVIVLARNLDGTLLNVQYDVLGEGSFVGWMRTADLELITTGASIANLPVGS